MAKRIVNRPVPRDIPRPNIGGARPNTQLRRPRGAASAGALEYLANLNLPGASADNPLTIQYDENGVGIDPFTGRVHRRVGNFFDPGSGPGEGQQFQYPGPQANAPPFDPTTAQAIPGFRQPNIDLFGPMQDRRNEQAAESQGIVDKLDEQRKNFWPNALSWLFRGRNAAAPSGRGGGILGQALGWQNQNPGGNWLPPNQQQQQPFGQPGIGRGQVGSDRLF